MMQTLHERSKGSPRGDDQIFYTKQTVAINERENLAVVTDSSSTWTKRRTDQGVARESGYVTQGSAEIRVYALSPKGAKTLKDGAEAFASAISSTNWVLALLIGGAIAMGLLLVGTQDMLQLSFLKDAAPFLWIAPVLFFAFAMVVWSFGRGQYRLPAAKALDEVDGLAVLLHSFEGDHPDDQQWIDVAARRLTDEQAFALRRAENTDPPSMEALLSIISDEWRRREEVVAAREAVLKAEREAQVRAFAEEAARGIGIPVGRSS